MKAGKTAPGSRSAARLAAVQALYDWEISAAPIDSVIADFLNHGLGAKAPMPTGKDEPEGELTALIEPEPVLFSALVRGAAAQRDRLDEILTNCLSADWPSERLEAVLRAILRVGAFELAERPDTPVRVVISEYVDVAHAFYAGPESKLVNAVLDRIAKVVREGELGPDAADR